MVRNFFAALMLALLLCGCGGGSSSHPVTLVSISVSPASTTIAPTTTTQFTATGNNSDGSTVDLTNSASWTSSNTAVATVSSLGVATAGVAGSSTITAASGGISGFATLTVAAVQSITVNPATPAVLLVGATQQFSAVALLSNGAQQTLTNNFVSWSSSTPGFATVNAAGVATGAGIGVAQITAAFGGVTSTPVSLTVVALQSITISPSNPTLEVGTSQRFTASGSLSNGTSRDVSSLVSWSSNNTASISIDSSGLALALASSATPATISGAFPGTPAGTTSVVVQAPTRITVTPSGQSIAAGVTLPFTATGTFPDGTRDLTNLVTWNSSVPGVATISNTAGSQGVATAPANAAGTTIISAALGGSVPVVGSTSLTAKTFASLTLTPPNPTIARGSALQLTAAGTFTGSSLVQDLTASATWSSSAPGIASVSNLPGTKGLVSALSLGTASITATIGSTTASNTVTVAAAGPVPSTNRAFVTNFGSNTLSVIDTSSNTLLLPDIPVGSGPQGVAVNPALNRVYVANSGGTLSVVDTASNAVIATVTLGGGGGSWGVALLPAANRAFVTNSSSNTLTVLDTSTNPPTVLTNIPVGAAPKGVVANPATSKVYVANSGDNTVTVVDGVNNVALAPVISVGSSPQDIALNPATSRAYVANAFSNILSLINLTTNSVAPVPVGTTHQGIAINPATNRVYVSNSNTGTVSVLDTSTNTELGAAFSPVIVGNNPLGIAVKAATSRVYVVNNGSNTVSVINTASDSDSLVTTIPVGSGPMFIAVIP